jgi:DNA-binding LytR/AlgR family response regulator
MLFAEREVEEQADPASLMKFYDEYKKLRFVITSEAVIFLKSEENYVQIHYLDHGKPKKFVLRSSMRALEEQMGRHGLVRCHRSYFINPEHIKMIRKESSGGVSAELKQESLEPIPISRKYQQEVTNLL